MKTAARLGYRIHDWFDNVQRYLVIDFRRLSQKARERFAIRRLCDRSTPLSRRLSRSASGLRRGVGSGFRYYYLLSTELCCTRPDGVFAVDKIFIVLIFFFFFNVSAAFNKTMGILEKQGKSITSFNYNNKEIADHIYSAINSTQFLGISVGFRESRTETWNNNTLFVRFQGWVAFSSQGDRIALTQIEQVIDGKYVLLGYYDTQSDNLTWFDKERWIGVCII